VELFQKEESVLTDFHCIEAQLDLPEFRVIDQVLGPKQLELHLERRATTIICPRCHRSCSQVRESRLQSIRDLPILERPVMLWLPIRHFACRGCPHRPWEKSETFGTRTKWTERLYKQVQTEFLWVVHATNWPVAMVCLSVPCFARRLKRAVAAVPESSAEL
jgi:transposase